MAYRFITKIQILSFFVFVFGVLIISRLVSLQIFKSDSFKDRAERQYIQPKEGLIERGNIYFSDKDGGRFLAAGIESGFKVVVNQNKIINPEESAKKLSLILGLEYDYVYKKIKGNDPYEILKDRISKDISEKIIESKIAGLSLERSKWRSYPAQSIASQIVGFVGFDGNEIKGRYGIEKQYENILSRKADNLHINFFAEVFLSIKSYILDEISEEGNIILTIEPKVAFTFENILKRTQEKWNSQIVGGVIMNPKTGEIIAMANVPNFDPNNFGNVSDLSFFRNQSASGVFELGSVVKPLVMASAIDVGAVTPLTTYIDLGNVQVGNKNIHNFDKKGRGQVNMGDVLIQSLNTGMVFAQQKMKKEDFKKYMDNFELNKKTEVDLPNEEKGNLNNLNTKRDVEYATASFGQGISMTPLGLARAFSVFANQGKMVKPYVVKSIEYIDPLKKPIYTNVSFSDQILKPETVDSVTKMLVNVVDIGLNNGKHKMEHFRIAAKTGTAQIPNPVSGGYYEDRYLHSLIGYYPAYDPKFLVLMYNFYPKGASYASVSLADPFFELADFLLSYYNVEPDR